MVANSCRRGATVRRRPRCAAERPRPPCPAPRPSGHGGHRAGSPRPRPRGGWTGCGRPPGASPRAARDRGSSRASAERRPMASTTKVRSCSVAVSRTRSTASTAVAKPMVGSVPARSLSIVRGTPPASAVGLALRGVELLAGRRRQHRAAAAFIPGASPPLVRRAPLHARPPSAGGAGGAAAAGTTRNAPAGAGIPPRPSWRAARLTHAVARSGPIPPGIPRAAGSGPSASSYP